MSSRSSTRSEASLGPTWPSSPDNTLSRRDVSSVLAVKREHEENELEERLAKKLRTSKSIADKRVGELGVTDRARLLEALSTMPKGFRICCNTTGVDMAFSRLATSTPRAISTVEEAKKQGFGPYEGECVPWDIYDMSQRNSFQAIEVVFWIQGALKHVNLIILKLRGYPDIAVKAGVASSSQVERKIHANLNPPDHGDTHSELTSDMRKKDHEIREWQAVCRILFFKRELLEATQ
jgi:hypothetical protein